MSSSHKPTKSIDHTTRYRGLNKILQQHFGEKISRVTLNAGMSCPNIDGTRAKGGCSFCNDDYLLAKSWEKQLSISEQMRLGLEYVAQRHGTKKFLAYFQNGTNTHAPVEKLRSYYNEALQDPRVVGMMISTRPDCLSEPVLDLLSEINERTYLWVETGLQSAQNHVLQKMNRAHSVEEFAESAQNLAQRKIRHCAHIILGLPDESKKEMLNGVEFVNALPIEGIKIHNLFVTRFTALEKWWREGKYIPLTLAEYASLCVDYLEKLRPDMIIHRLNAHGPARLTAAPEWSINKLATMNAVHDELVKRDTWQGKFFQK